MYNRTSNITLVFLILLSHKGIIIIQKHIVIEIQGVIQGIGMRPFIAQLATQFQQNGWVNNTASGVSINIEGDAELQNNFIEQLKHRPPDLAKITSIVIRHEPLAGFEGFQIKPSATEGVGSMFVLPDLAVCQACTRDVFDPASRFYRYPFTSCTNCGPRFSIMTSQPYDRTRTSMTGFTLCSHCAHDYRDIQNRRTHAQTIACPECGPTLSFLDETGIKLAEREPALKAAIAALRGGKIVALKSIGGFQLIVDATNQDAVQQLRIRKQRPQKPFAIMVADLPAAEQISFISTLEQQALTSQAAPIVLLNKRANNLIANAVAPESNLLGIMLPYSPLHLLLLSDFGLPLVATSGNVANDPICIDTHQALQKLGGIADYFLVHNRPILRPLDDSVVRLIGGKITVLRRARGYVPTPISISTELSERLAMGGHQKNTVAMSRGKQIVLSQHLGDLDSEATLQQYHVCIDDLSNFYQINPINILHDLHTGYSSSQAASQIQTVITPTPTLKTVQHHYAHVLSCMAEHDVLPPVLGIAWDGSGLGTDNTLWGGEFLLINQTGFKRFARFRQFGLPGGTKAIQEPRRAALGLLYEIFADQGFEKLSFAFSEQELSLLSKAMRKSINCPRTNSVGRLFDAVASLLRVCQISQFEGQAAMQLEELALSCESETMYSFEILDTELLTVDWETMLLELLGDITYNNVSTELIAHKFHNTLAEICLVIALRVEQPIVCLSGGCFQNALLTMKTIAKLTTAGFRVYCHENIPPNDGGLSLGQIYAATYLG